MKENWNVTGVGNSQELCGFGGKKCAKEENCVQRECVECKLFRLFLCLVMYCWVGDMNILRYLLYGQYLPSAKQEIFGAFPDFSKKNPQLTLFPVGYFYYVEISSK